ncbi:MAG: glycoside hydrolase TIM-barrel-like domain-containing protein [Candidatus Omnitrophica bacterium]|nr:glycoside hydrolase TIM-barrel-like domain-containing protein [Candidatus Omnitrophota bacterium]
MFSLKITKITVSILTLTVFILSASCIPDSISLAQTELSAPILSMDIQKGMCFVTWDKNSFSSYSTEKALARLKGNGASHVQINVTHYQETYNSTSIKATELTPSDSSVQFAIKSALKNGLEVMLKPHIDLLDSGDGSYWRADIGFQNETDWKKWFASYKQFILHYARIAEKNNVSIFAVGTELSFTTQKTSDWKDIIAEVKKIYSGKLIYAANWDEYKNVQFWGDLDFMGIDAYFPLTYKTDPSVEDIKKGWSKWIQEIEMVQKSVNKPVIFTEIGYASTKNAPSKPWENGTSGNADTDIQAKCYKAFFEAVWARPWLKGVYFWKWDPSVSGGGKNNRDFTPLNKPAEQILASVFKSEDPLLSPGVSEHITKMIGNKVQAPASAIVPDYVGTIASKAQRHLPTLDNGNLLGINTLQPALKTAHKGELVKEWAKIHQEIMDSKKK